jgi:hypothetical protein
MLVVLAAEHFIQQDLDAVIHKAEPKSFAGRFKHTCDPAEKQHPAAKTPICKSPLQLHNGCIKTEKCHEA